jgi:hypothetical protein
MEATMNTTQQIDNWYKNQYQALQTKYATEWLSERDHPELHYINEKYRAHMVILASGGTPEASSLRHYSIPSSIISELCGNEEAEPERRVRQKDKRQAIKDWTQENIGLIVTPQEVADAGDVSYATAIKFINENIGTFIKAGRGKYEIRDIKAQREAEKKKA